MEFRPGDIVLIKFPFSDSKGYKKRPALILQGFDDGDVIICRITSKVYQSPFDEELPDWEKCGLLLPSVIRVHKLITVELSLIDQKLGEIPINVFDRVTTIFNSILKQEST